MNSGPELLRLLHGDLILDEKVVASVLLAVGALSAAPVVSDLLVEAAAGLHCGRVTTLLEAKRSDAAVTGIAQEHLKIVTVTAT